MGGRSAILLASYSILHYFHFAPKCPNNCVFFMGLPLSVGSWRLSVGSGRLSGTQILGGWVNQVGR